MGRYDFLCLGPAGTWKHFEKDGGRLSFNLSGESVEIYSVRKRNLSGVHPCEGKKYPQAGACFFKFSLGDALNYKKSR